MEIIIAEVDAERETLLYVMMNILFISLTLLKFLYDKKLSNVSIMLYLVYNL